MRLKHIEVADYKNLQNFKLNLNGESFIDILVGKNGTGKSNFFEALLEIFQHLLESEYVISFPYKLKWEINNTEHYICWDGTNWKNIDDEVTTKPTLGNLPENIIIYYSGHNENLNSVIKQYEDAHRTKLNSNRNSTTFLPETIRKFIGIDSSYKSILLAVMLLQSDDLIARQFILDKLDISNIDAEIKITVKRPFYALNNSSLNFKQFKSPEEKRFWGAEGFFEEFLELLWNSDKIESGKIRTEGYINTEDGKTDHLIMYRSFASIKQQLAGRNILEIFALFDNLRSIGMLDEISFKVNVSGELIDINKFSDGQFQSIYIYAITELFKNKNCITLLDEPDSFLHPEWQHEFLTQVSQINQDSAKSNHAIMSSHSAVTLISHEQQSVNIFRFKDENLISHTTGKGNAIKELSSSLLKYSEEEQIISILNRIYIENKPVFFTEGSTDPIILKEAWNNLFEDEIPFIPIYAFNCQYLRRLLGDNRIHNEMGDKPFFGLFDFDIAYNDWKGLKWDVIEEDPFKGCICKLNNKEGYAFLLPIPNVDEVKKQVIKNQETNETFLGDSKVEIEHLFFNNPTARTLFETEATMGGGTKWIFPSGQKTHFAKNIIPTIEQEYFEVFRPMLEFVRATITESVSADA
jgi:predicted ATPase